MTQLLAFGINHNTASIAVREQLSFNAEQIPLALNHLSQHSAITEIVLLSTCNRTEFYCSVPEQYDGQNHLLDWLSDYRNMNRAELAACTYCHQNNEAIRHLFRVACGLDSMVLGEPQILGQLKAAYRFAQDAKTIDTLLERLFQHSFSVAKRIRTDTEIGSSPVSVAFAAVRLAQQIFGKFNNYTALLLGAGETIELVARHLHENELGRMIVANRTLERARHLAVELDGYAITLSEIPRHLSEADIVIASTASPDPLLSKDMVATAMLQRKHRPMLLIDLAVPRDIAADVEELEDIYLYSVDDLNEVIQENLRSRTEAAQQAEEIIDTEVSHFLDWLKSRSVVESICALRAYTKKNSEQLRNKAIQLLNKGKDPEEVIDFVIHRMSNQWLHTPCIRLREAGSNGDQDFIDITKRLFDLDT